MKTPMVIRIEVPVVVRGSASAERSRGDNSLDAGSSICAVTGDTPSHQVPTVP